MNAAEMAAAGAGPGPGPPSLHHHHHDDDNEATTTKIPQWIQEQCTRLRRGQDDLRKLNLNRHRLDRPMVEALSSALRCNGRIEVVNLTSSLNRGGGTLVIGDRQNDTDRRRCRKLVAPLAFAIQCHPSIHTLYLSFNLLVDVTPLAISLEMNQSALRELQLGHNNLGPETAIALAQMLQVNDTLRVLQLNWNRIGDVGGVAIAQALGRPLQRGGIGSKNGGLKTLGLAGNGLGHETLTELWNALHTHSNVALTELHLDDNSTDLYGDGTTATVVTNRVMWLVRANRAGRYLLQQHGGGEATTNHPLAEPRQQQQHHPPLTSSSSISLSSSSTAIKTTKPTPRPHAGIRRGLWPYVLMGLEVDILYYFLREKPDLVPGR